MTPPSQLAKGLVFRRPLKRRPALVAATLCWAGFALVAWLVVGGHVTAFDRTGLLMWRTGPALGPAGPGWLTASIRDVTLLGSTVPRTVIVLGAIAALVLLRRRRDALLLVLTVGGGWATEGAIKALVARPRPELVSHLATYSGASFPSGHAFNSAVICLSLALVFGSMCRRRALRIAILGVAIALTLAIGFSRVWLGVHYPSDVLAGWLGGTGWVLLVTGLVSSPARRSAG